MSIEVKLNRLDRIYHPGDKVSGAVVVHSNGSMSHSGITLQVEGNVTLQLSARSVGLFEAFYSSLKPVQLLQYNFEITPSGTVPAGTTEFPFEFTLRGFNAQRLFDTYHGVYVNVSYVITVEMMRSMLSNNLKRTLEFIVETLPAEETKTANEKQKAFEFSISPDSLQNVRKQARHKIPDFLFEGQLDSTFCFLGDPLTGSVTIRKCAVDIKSIELQLVRVETCSYMEGEAREATEIQNIQIADGNITHDLTIPIYMVFPRLFTCGTVKSKAFKIEFELNLIVVFVDSHMVTENFSLVLHR